jgi:hypothetical protein
MPRKSTIARKMSIQKRLHGMDQFQADAIDPEKERCVEGAAAVRCRRRLGRARPIEHGIL